MILHLILKYIKSKHLCTFTHVSFKASMRLLLGWYFMRASVLYLICVLRPHCLWVQWIGVLYCNFHWQNEPEKSWLALTVSDFLFQLMWINWALARPVLDHCLMRRNDWQSALFHTFVSMGICARECVMNLHHYMRCKWLLLLIFIQIWKYSSNHWQK